MKTYKEAFVYYEDTELHPEIQEVSELEIKMERLCADLKKVLNDDTIYQLDSLVGEIARAYEMQGFAFAQNVLDFKETDEKLRAENIEQRRPKKKTNSTGKNGIPTREVTSCGFTKTISEWKKFLDCSMGTLYTHLNRGPKHFDTWVQGRMAIVRV